jgi:CheY-like chemotaxis protein
MLEAAAPGTYDMILLDVQMPVMDGYTAARRIRESQHPEAKTIPIAAMTANAFEEDVRQALQAGMNAHIAKPVDMNLLKETVASLLQK